MAKVLKSSRATQVSIKVIEVFVLMREKLSDTLRLEIDVELVFSYLEELMVKKENLESRNPIGFKRENEL